MKTRLAILFAASLGLLHAGAPALAQDSDQETGSTIRIPAPSPPPSDAVGNPQLRNFSLSGNVTRPSSAPAPVEPAARPEPTPRQQTAQQNIQRIAPQNEQASERRQAAPSVPPVAMQAAEPAARSGMELAVPPTPAAAPALRWDPPAAAAATIADSPPGGISIFPWLLAALFFGASAAWYFLRQRPRARYAGAGAVDRFEAPPAQAPQRPASASPPRPLAAPRPAAPAKTGTHSGLVVSTRLRPWLEIEFVPIRGVVDDDKSAVAFKVSVFNSGSVPARDILVEACLINAGPEQDQEIQQFFAYPVAKGNRLPIIPPLKRVEVESAVALQRDMLRPIEIEGRTLFVPMVAFNVLYSWSSGEGQTSASYLVGKETKGEKLAPFRLDLGPRIFRNLASREHQLGLRK